MLHDLFARPCMLHRKEALYLDRSSVADSTEVRGKAIERSPSVRGAHVRPRPLANASLSARTRRVGWRPLQTRARALRSPLPRCCWSAVGKAPESVERRTSRGGRPLLNAEQQLFGVAAAHLCTPMGCGSSTRSWADGNRKQNTGRGRTVGEACQDGRWLCRAGGAGGCCVQYAEEHQRR